MRRSYLRWLRNAGIAAQQDFRMRLRYGSDAPRFAERLWVPTATIEQQLNLPGRATGLVRGGDWDLGAVPLRDDEWEIRACRARWMEGFSWEQNDVFDRFARALTEKGKKDGCRTLTEVRRRYERLDRLFEQASTEGVLRSQGEINPWAFREYDGILVHVDRHGCPVFGRRGCHRFAVARLLNIEHIPVQVGVVHQRAVPGWRAAFL